jgi:hypothetical protein
MAALKSSICTGLGVALCLSVIISCGGGGGSNLGPPPPPPPPAGSNTVSVIFDEGPTPSAPTLNTPYTTVTVCVPGTTTCQTIDHITVDTGSYGLRLLSTAVSLNLPILANSTGNTLAECTIFGIGFVWGPVVAADIKIAGETASAQSVQIAGDPGYTSVPADCVAAGGVENDTVESFGSNGVLGVGPFVEDCGDACVAAVQATTYYSCSATGTMCVGTQVNLANQVSNPVAAFAVDNNGIILQLPSVASGGVTSLTGTLTFGIDTQSNNASGSQTVLNVNDMAELTMIYNGVSLPESFIDSGSNGIFFNDANITQCSGTGFAGFYCANLTGLAVSIEGANGMMANNLTFGINSAMTIPVNFAVYPGFAGTNPIGNNSFDYGVAFFFGKRVAVALEGDVTKVGTGPYFAF